MIQRARSPEVPARRTPALDRLSIRSLDVDAPRRRRAGPSGDLKNGKRSASAFLACCPVFFEVLRLWFRLLFEIGFRVPHGEKENRDR
jgi:hypothetical protein